MLFDGSLEGEAILLAVDLDLVGEFALGWCVMGDDLEVGEMRGDIAQWGDADIGGSKIEELVGFGESREAGEEGGVHV